MIAYDLADAYSVLDDLVEFPVSAITHQFEASRFAGHALAHEG